MHLAFRSATHDIITSYSFSECFNLLDHPTFSDPIMVGIMAMMPAIWVLKHFNWITNLPGRRLLGWNQGFQSLMYIRQTLTKQVETFQADKARLENTSHETIYHHLLAPTNNPCDQISTSGLVDEAMTLLAAGSDTVGHTCTSAVFYTLATPRALERLIDELHNAWPNKNSEVGLRTLEKLPYLVRSFDLYRVLSVFNPYRLQLSKRACVYLLQLFHPFRES